MSFTSAEERVRNLDAILCDLVDLVDLVSRAMIMDQLTCSFPAAVSVSSRNASPLRGLRDEIKTVLRETSWCLSQISLYW